MLCVATTYSGRLVVADRAHLDTRVPVMQQVLAINGPDPAGKQHAQAGSVPAWMRVNTARAIATVLATMPVTRPGPPICRAQYASASATAWGAASLAAGTLTR